MSEFAATLTVVRHARAEAAAVGQTDFDRPLAPGAEADLAGVGTELLAPNAPALFLVSPARRTRATAEALAAEAGQGEIRFIDDFYNAPAGVLWAAAVGELRDRTSVVVVAHNPGVSNLATELADVSVRFVPAGRATFGFRTVDDLDRPRTADAVVRMAGTDF